MAKTGAAGIKRIINAGIYSLQGLKSGFKYEAAVRQELLMAAVLTVAAFFISDDLGVLLLLLILPWLTLAFELMNSAIEAVVDRIGDEYHVLSGRAKDLGSACVFVLLVLTGAVYLIAFLFKLS